MFFSDTGWWMPNGEEHLLSHLFAANNYFDGRFCYQRQKYLAASGLVHQHRLAVDVGAHVGLWSWQMAHDFDRVIAFEPVAEHRECFVKNLQDQLRGAIELHGYALGAETKLVSLTRLTRDSSGNTAIDPPGSKTKSPLVEQFRLDDVVLSEPIDLLKIDCEGYELAVVRGGERVIRKDRPAICIEQKPETDMERRYGHRPRAAVDLLVTWGAKVRGEMVQDYFLSWD